MTTVKPERTHVLITGAARGIGFETAKALIDKGYCVIGSSRAPEAYTEGDDLFPFPLLKLDIADYDSREDFCSRFMEATGYNCPDIVIHNAGTSQIGAAEEVSRENLDYIMKLNFSGIVMLNNQLIPYMRRRGYGKIIHISSLAAQLPVPFSSIYAASKAALEAYAVSLRAELRPYSIQVSTIFFDYVRTDLQQIRTSPTGGGYSERESLYKAKRDRLIEAGMPPAFVGKEIARIALKKDLKTRYGIGKRARSRSLAAKIIPDMYIEKLKHGIFEKQ